MPNDAQVTTLIAGTLGIPEATVRDGLAYGEVPQWDSLNHVKLMLALEQLLDVEVGEDEMVELTTVAAIRVFVTSNSSAGA